MFRCFGWQYFTHVRHDISELIFSKVKELLEWRPMISQAGCS